jgi:hypothetical protein
MVFSSIERRGAHISWKSSFFLVFLILFRSDRSLIIKFRAYFSLMIVCVLGGRIMIPAIIYFFIIVMRILLLLSYPYRLLMNIENPFLILNYRRHRRFD